MDLSILVLDRPWLTIFKDSLRRTQALFFEKGHRRHQNDLAMGQNSGSPGWTPSLSLLQRLEQGRVVVYREKRSGTWPTIRTFTASAQPFAVEPGIGVHTPVYEHLRQGTMCSEKENSWGGSWEMEWRCNGLKALGGHTKNLHRQ